MLQMCSSKKQKNNNRAGMGSSSACNFLEWSLLKYHLYQFIQHSLSGQSIQQIKGIEKSPRRINWIKVGILLL